MDLKLAVKVNDLDNVATIFAEEVVSGLEIEVRDKKGGSEILGVIGDIPYGHKIALVDIAPGSDILKYGECIGGASRPIKKGEHVHVHNLDSRRGRGDL
jgi:altronate dehydratase small subunit